MRHHSPAISNHRLQRLHRWAMLWLAWFVGFLDAAAAFAPITKAVEEIGHRWLDRIERHLVCIIILRVAPQVRRLNAPKGMPRRNLSALFRAMIGSRVRKALRSRNLRQRIDALRQDIGALVARVLRRMPCGLTRRCPMRTRPEARRICACSASAAAAFCADTS